jgi:DinB family protein
LLDFTLVKNKTLTFSDLARDLTKTDLRNLTNEMIDTMLSIIADATDEDVVFVPQDPNADDPYGIPEEKNLVWTLGHVAVHTTASSEESAALALTLARGLIPEGRSRYEVPWRSVQTIDQVRHRFEESRRMRLAMLDAWPDEPHLEVTYSLSPRFGPYNATSRFLMGLYHDDDHLGQLREIMRQVRESRFSNTVHQK